MKNQSTTKQMKMSKERRKEEKEKKKFKEKFAVKIFFRQIFRRIICMHMMQKKKLRVSPFFSCSARLFATQEQQPPRREHRTKTERKYIFVFKTNEINVFLSSMMKLCDMHVQLHLHSI